MAKRNTGIDIAVVKHAVFLACRAPSVHNSQPWRWVVERGELRLFADTSRIPRATDASGREALISCGAALDHFRVAMAASGWSVYADRFPNPSDRTHLANLGFTPMTQVMDSHRQRAAAIAQRRTDRLPFAPPEQWHSFERLLWAVIDQSAAFVDVIDDSVRGQLAEASRLSEALRRYDTSYSAELAWWTPPFTKADGIPQNELISIAEANRVDIGRTFPPAGTRDRRLELKNDQSKVVAISARDETAGSMVHCGEVLSQVLLESTLAKLATCTLTHMLELPDSAAIVSNIVGRPLPQVLIRVGVAPSLEVPPPPSPRRPLADVLEVVS